MNIFEFKGNFMNVILKLQIEFIYPITFPNHYNNTVERKFEF